MRHYWLWLSVLSALLGAVPARAAALPTEQPETWPLPAEGAAVSDEVALATGGDLVPEGGAVENLALADLALKKSAVADSLLEESHAFQFGGELAQAERPAGRERETSTAFQITRHGFFVPLTATAQARVAIAPSADGRHLELDLPGTTLPETLQATPTLTINHYGVQQATFNQVSASPPHARITLELTGEIPAWEAAMGDRGLAIVPAATVLGSQAAPSPPPELAQRDARDRVPRIQSVQLGLGNQLLIVADRPLSRPRSRRLPNGVYEITIPNARLAERVDDPRLRQDSPVSQLNLREQSDGTVVLLVQLADDIEIANVTQPRQNLVALQFQRQQVAQPPRQPLPPREPLPSPLPPRQPSNLGPLPRITSGRALVTIDPGHGGRDPGAIGIGGLREKDVVLPISLEVAQILQQQGVRVQMTRNDDRYVTLAGRAQIANQTRSHVFVSIHANAISMSRPDVNGVETFYYTSGRELAQMIQSSILRSISIGNRGVKRARFYVLRYTAMPSALVEVGFVTGQYDAPRLANPAFRSQMAEAIARGILEYLQWRRF